MAEHDAPTPDVDLELTLDVDHTLIPRPFRLGSLERDIIRLRYRGQATPYTPAILLEGLGYGEVEAELLGLWIPLPDYPSGDQPEFEVVLATDWKTRQPSLADIVGAVNESLESFCVESSVTHWVAGDACAKRDGENEILQWPEAKRLGLRGTEERFAALRAAERASRPQ